MVSCQESKSSADMSTASPPLEWIRTGIWSSLTCWMSGNRRERASLALTATAHHLHVVRHHGTAAVRIAGTSEQGQLVGGYAAEGVVVDGDAADAAVGG